MQRCRVIRRRGCFHELFEEQVRRTPHAIAVVHGRKGSLTYRELNAEPIGWHGILRTMASAWTRS